MRRFVLLISVALFATLAVAGCGSGGDKTKTAAIPSASPTTSTTSTTPASSSGGCQNVSQPPARTPAKQQKPTQPLDASKHWTLTFVTSCGPFTVALDLKTAPKASASMVSLARAGFFDHTVFHRIVPGFVIQGGDPSATGQGGPGYGTVDKPPSNAKYTRGVVAMAKTGSEKAGTGGSQFFVVTGPDAQLPPDYALLGKVTKGLDVVERIGQLGGPDERPTQAVVISSVKAGGG